MFLWLKENKVVLFICLSLFFIQFSISFGQGFFAIALVLWFFEKKETEPKEQRPQNSALWVALAAWGLYRLSHIFLNEDILNDLFKARELWMLLMLPLVAFNIKNDKQLLLLSITIVFASVVPSLSAVINFASVNFDLLNNTARKPSFESLHHLTFAGNNSLVLVASFVLLGQFIIKKRRTFVILTTLCILTNAAGLASSRSLGVLLALSVLLALFFLVRFRYRAIAVFIPALILLFQLTPERFFNSDWLQKAPKTVNVEKYCGSFEERLTIWWTGLRMIKDKPLFGTGESDYLTEYHRFKHPKSCGVALAGTHMHNDILDVSVNFGFVGLLLWLLLILKPIFDFFALSIGSSYLNYLRFLLPTCLLLIGLSQCHFTDDEVQMTYWALLGLGYLQRNDIQKLSAS
jgi:O-antigen ligase